MTKTIFPKEEVESADLRKTRIEQNNDHMRLTHKIQCRSFFDPFHASGIWNIFTLTFKQLKAIKNDRSQQMLACSKSPIKRQKKM